MGLHALRAAITIDVDSPEEINRATKMLLQTLYERNDLSHEDVISILFTATGDITAAPPAAAAREFGLVDVPLLCAAEMPVVGGIAMCIRMMLHIETEKPRSDLRHAFLRGAVVLRPELAEPGDADL